MQDSELPVKANKKKSSFLDDDDFFVMKKPKKSKPKPAPEAIVVASEQTAITLESSQTTPPNAESENVTPKANGRAIPGAQRCSSEERNSPFYSASETFSDSAPFSLTLMDTIERDNSDEKGIELVEIKQDNAIVFSESSLKSEAETIQDDGDEEEDSDLRSFFKNVTASREETIDEANRLYDIEIKCKGALSLVFKKRISGNTTFMELIEVVLREALREFALTNYFEKGALVWVEGKSELKPIFKPSTLRIPPKRGEVSRITCLYIPRNHLPVFDKLYKEFIDANDEANIDIAADDDQPTVYSLLGSESEEENVQEAPKREYFVIGLKGKDNKRVEAEVGQSTKIRSLLKYYLQVKGIKDAQLENCKLLFDDEELELDSVVGDTELEEDFEIQVHIN